MLNSNHYTNTTGGGSYKININSAPSTIIVAGTARRGEDGNAHICSPLQADQAPSYYIPLSITSQVPIKQPNRLPLKMVVSEIARREDGVQTMSQNTECQHNLQNIDDLLLISNFKVQDKQKYRGYHNMPNFNSQNKSMDLTNKKKKLQYSTMTSNSHTIDKACRKYSSIYKQYSQKDVSNERNTQIDQPCSSNTNMTTDVSIPTINPEQYNLPLSQTSSIYSSLSQTTLQDKLTQTDAQHNDFQGLMEPYFTDYMKSIYNNVGGSGQNTQSIKQIEKTMANSSNIDNIYYNKSDVIEVAQNASAIASSGMQESNIQTYNKYPIEVTHLHTSSPTRLLKTEQRNKSRKTSSTISNFNADRFIHLVKDNKALVNDDKCNLYNNKDNELNNTTINFPQSYGQEHRKEQMPNLNSYSNSKSNNDMFSWKPIFCKPQVVCNMYDSKYNTRNAELENRHSVTEEENISRVHNNASQNGNYVNSQFFTSALKKTIDVHTEKESNHSDTESQSTESYYHPKQKTLVPCFTDPDDNYLASEESLDSTTDE